jgi:predicted transcriptional regulator of viral defense system
VSDVRLIEVAAAQHRCVTRRQLLALGYADDAIVHRLNERRLVHMHDGVYAIAPAPYGDRTRWMAATLTTPGSALSHASAGAAYGFRPLNAPFVVITRAGSGGPEHNDGVLVCRSTTLARNTTTLENIPITTPERTLIDLAAALGDKALARAVREAIRLNTTTPSDLFIALARHRGRRGTRRLHAALSRYAGLPLHSTPRHSRSPRSAPPAAPSPSSMRSSKARRPT